jgi:hypothetical protein
MPQLPLVDIELHRASTAFSEAADGFVQLLIDGMAGHEHINLLPAAQEAKGPPAHRA